VQAWVERRRGQVARIPRGGYRAARSCRRARHPSRPARRV